jgi:hypothetical protein
MEKYKDLYEAPAITVVNVNIEGVVCKSPGQTGTQNYNWHGDYEE